MMSMPGAIWRVVAKRLVADWLILAAASVTVLIATILLAAGPIYADAVTVSGVARTMADAPTADANIEISTLLQAEDLEAANQLVETQIDAGFASVGATINLGLLAESYELPEQPSPSLTDLASFRYLRGIESHASLLAGQWPEAIDGVAAAVPEAVAAALALEVGDTLEVTNRRDRSAVSTVTVAGIYQIDDPRSAFWFEDETETSGTSLKASFRTYGPFVVSVERLIDEFSPARVEARWRVLPAYQNLTLDDVSQLRGAIGGLQVALDNAPLEGVDFTVTTKAPEILAGSEQSLLVTRSGVMALTVQLAMLAGYALLLTAGLLVDSRRVEMSLLRARGASNRQILTLAIMEGMLLTAPAVLAAPWLAARLLRILNHVGPLAAIDLTIVPALTPSAYVLAMLAAIGCVAALAVPAHTAARSLEESGTDRKRQRRTSGLQRAGVDVGILVVAGIAYWQLKTFGVQITTRGRGWFEVDPLLIGAPALGLLAGALLALRTVPLLARLAEQAATAGRSVVSALSAWQVARRPARYARSALLLILAVAIGFFAAAFTTTWNQSKADQAAFEVGADIRLIANRRTNDSIADLQLRQAHGQLSGVRASMPVRGIQQSLARSGGQAEIVLLDAALAPEVVHLRPDLSSSPFPTLMKQLVNGRPELASLPLEGEPKRIALAITVRAERRGPKRLEGPILPGIEDSAGPPFSPVARVVVQDGDGYLHRVHLGPIPVNRGPARVEADLVYELSNGELALPTYPLSLVDIEIESPTPDDVSVDATINLTAVLTNPETGGNDWRHADAVTSWDLDIAPVSGLFNSPTIGLNPTQPPQGLSFSLNTGLGFGDFVVPVHFSARPAGTQLPDTFPIIITERLIEEASTNVGGELRVFPVRSLIQTAEIVGTVKEFPTVAPSSGEAILVDLPTFQMMSYQPGSRIQAVDEFWIAVEEEASGSLADALLRPPYESFRVVDQADRVDTLQTDPVALGTIGSLSVGFVAAAVFAAVGFTVSAVVSARERLAEFALMRALGLTRKQLSGWLWLEQSVLVLVSLALGTLSGALLAWLILPLIAITQEGSSVTPAVVVHVPWPTIVRLELTVVAALAAVVTSLGLVLRRLGLSSLLRLGED